MLRNKDSKNYNQAKAAIEIPPSDRARGSFWATFMPIHDWSRVFDGAFHDFHLAWIVALRNTLNSGLLPPDYYAMVEQVARPTVPDVLTLKTTNGFNGGWSGEPVSGATAVAIAPPRVRETESIEQEIFARRQK